jgi:two-component system, cell cycle sensor histidine kinase and response regulator CckA
MQSAVVPQDETRRLEAVRTYQPFDTVPETAFGDLAGLAARLCETPMAAVSLVDRDTVWFTSTFGWPLRLMSREASFCAHAILQPDVFVVPDAALDLRFADNPLVTGETRVRFYAGVPLTTSGGHAIGVLCVMDRAPRPLSSPQRETLPIVGRQVLAQLDLRRQTRDLTEREARLRFVTDSAPVGLVVLNQDRRYVYVNSAYHAMFDLPARSIVGARVSEVLAGLYHEQIGPRLDRAFAGERVSYQLQIAGPMGDRYYSVCYEPRGAGAASRVVVGVVTDITAHRADAVLRGTEGRYRTLFDYAPDGIVVSDADGRYLDVNASMSRMLGYTRDELLALRTTDIVVPSEAAQIELARRLVAEQSTYQREWHLRRRDGSVFPAEVRVTRTPDGNRLGVVRDVSERVRATDALRHAEERMRFALENANVGIWDVDFTTGIVEWSATLEAHYGLEPGTFGGTLEAFVGQVHPDDRAALRAAIAEAERTGFDFTTEHRALWRDGTVRWLSGAGRILRDEGGRPRRGVGISLDVTERRTLEAQYQQAQKMDAVGRLAGGVAHDFNNMLTSILGYCELLLECLEPGSPLAHDVAEIQAAGTAAAGLTRQLLTFSRRHIIEPTLLDLNAVVNDIRRMIGRIIGEDIVVTVALAADPALVVADRGEMEQVVLNLAVNAREAMPTGGRLTIETAHVELDDVYAASHIPVTPGRYVVLTMTDTGTGMTDDVQAHLFEPFFTTKESGRGTGLGLAAVHGIVTRIGGSIGVYSEVGIGTSFKVYLPRADAASVVAAPPVPAADARTRTRTVLVVEDAEGVRELARRLLERDGYTVLVAADADEALKIFDGHGAIDVVLTDVVMPGASGPELTKQLIERRPGLKTILMSGYTAEAIAHHGVLEAGIAFLQKPFTSDALGRKVREVLDR